MSDADTLRLGSCCICGREEDVHTIIMLSVKGLVPGHGWGCFVCGLAPDGASAVLCGTCTLGWEDGTEALRFACRGYPAEDGRVSIEALTEAHEHNPKVAH